MTTTDAPPTCPHGIYYSTCSICSTPLDQTAQAHLFFKDREIDSLRAQLQAAEREVKISDRAAEIDRSIMLSRLCTERREAELEMAEAVEAFASWGHRVGEYGKSGDARIAELEALLRKIDDAFNPAGCEVDMPEALGGETLFDALCKIEELLQKKTK